MLHVLTAKMRNRRLTNNRKLENGISYYDVDSLKPFLKIGDP